MKRLLALTLILSSVCSWVAAGDAAPGEKVQYGPFLSHTVVNLWPKGATTPKGITIKLGGEKEAALCFDTDLLRVSEAWTGGFLTLQGVAFDGQHGFNPLVTGTHIFGTRHTPGWAYKGKFDDPRPVPYGPLPRSWGKYKGLYKNGNKIVLSYSVGDCDVLEHPDFSNGVFSRNFLLGPSKEDQQLLVFEVEKMNGMGTAQSGDAKIASMSNGTDVTYAAAVAAPHGADFLFLDKGQLALKIPSHTEAISFKVAVWNVPVAVGAQEATRDETAAKVKALLPVADVKALCSGGAAQWPQAVPAVGKLSALKDPYVVDTITVPFENPLNYFMRVSGFDFFNDGRAAVCTWSGDVWVVSGIDETLQKLEWKRIASGLFQPLGLKIVKEAVYVTGRDQITKLVDLNGDGETDFYQNFNNDSIVTENFHEFSLDLQTDTDGNFYFAKAGPVKPGGEGFDPIYDHHGALLKIPADGSKIEVVCTGLRGPNGIGVGPHNELTSGDNDGTWMPACKINLIKPGGFYGCVDTAHRPQKPTSYDNPLCWLPRVLDNSGGGQAWVSGNKWGPFEGRLLHTSYGTCSLCLVFSEDVGGQVQGGAIRFPLNFASGIMRARFNPKDGQLYVAGLRGWQTKAAKFGCFQRVRYTGAPVKMPSEVHVQPDGLAVTFTCELDKELAADPENYVVEQWNYRWTSAYGSDMYSVVDPSKPGHDPLTIKSATLSADKKTVKLEIPGIKPVMQMMIKFKIKSADGAPVNYEIYNTINAVGTK